MRAAKILTSLAFICLMVTVALIAYRSSLETPDDVSATDTSIGSLVYPKAEGEALTAEHIMTAANRSRAENGQHALAESKALSDSACRKLEDMVKYDYWSHESPSGMTPRSFIEGAGYNFRAAAENLAYGHSSVSHLIRDWLDSASHRRALLSPNYLEQGACTRMVDFQGHYTSLTVHHFGSPL